MTLCPIALAVHCTGCPIVGVCPAKTLIGDFGKHRGKGGDSSTDPTVKLRKKP